jgi:hypothetical protein
VSADRKAPPFGDQLIAVVDAAESNRFAIVGMIDAAMGALEFVAGHPDRVSALVLYNATARWLRAPDYEAGLDPDAATAILGLIEAGWGSELFAERNLPSRAGDGRFKSWYAKYMRSIGTPTQVAATLGRIMALDARPFLEQIAVPTLVIHRRDYFDHPAGAGLLPRRAHRRRRMGRRARSGRAGVLGGHRRAAGGDREVPAVPGARKGSDDAVAELDVPLRIGVHLGEVELSDGEPTGTAVHLAARVMAAAEPREVLVNETTCEAVAGLGFTFTDAGEQLLKGFERPRRLYRLA